MASVVAPLKAPMPFFGGKSRIASVVWERFGDPACYVEPFAGSLAVLLARPHGPKIETVNDKDAFIANLWRAVQADPEAVAIHADHPVNENCLHARHLWLVNEGANRVERLTTDPDYYDVKVAGWWLWGICQWIGSGWCVGRTPSRQRPHLGGAGMGVHRQRPHLGDAGMGACAEWRAHLIEYMQALCDRLRRVRVCCGDWSRVVGPTPTFKNGLTAVFLDPPYAFGERNDTLYTVESDVSAQVREWAIANGDNPLLRLALCGYAGEHDMPADWECVEWKANGGYGSQGDLRGRENAHRERIWFNKSCLRPERVLTLFDWAEETEGT